jgi:hypothetical protein
MHKQTSFLITAAVLIAAVATVALYTANAAIAQPANMTAGGGNMTKSANMTAGGGNMTKSANMTIKMK